MITKEINNDYSGKKTAPVTILVFREAIDSITSVPETVLLRMVFIKNG